MNSPGAASRSTRAVTSTMYASFKPGSMESIVWPPRRSWRSNSSPRCQSRSPLASAHRNFPPHPVVRVDGEAQIGPGRKPVKPVAYLQNGQTVAGQVVARTDSRRDGVPVGDVLYGGKALGRQVEAARRDDAVRAGTPGTDQPNTGVDRQMLADLPCISDVSPVQPQPALRSAMASETDTPRSAARSPRRAGRRRDRREPRSPR